MWDCDQSEEILREPRYWTVAYCRTFLDRWDDETFGDPQKGCRMAAMGLELVTRVERQLGESQPVLRACALKIRGSSFRGVASYDEAWHCYKSALQLYTELEEPLDEADLYRRLVFYYRDLQDWAAALDFANRATKIFLAAGEKHLYGLVLIAKATTVCDSGDVPGAILIFSKALAKLEYERSPEAFYSAVHNLAAALAKEPESPDKLLHDALNWLAEARRASPSRGLGKKRYGYRKRTVPDAKLRYLLGLLLRRLRNRRDATRFFEEAREDLVDLGQPLDVVDAGLELGELYAEAGRWEELERLAAETVTLVAHRPQLAQLYEALRQWRTAVDARERLAEAAAACRALRAGQPARPGAVEVVDEATLRRRLQGILQESVAGCRSLEELEERLLAEGVSVRYRAASGERPAGIAFELEGRRFTGHQLGHTYRLSNLRRRWT